MSSQQVPSPRRPQRVVPLAGELDLATVAQLSTAISWPGECLVLDLTAVTFLDASALGVIAGAAWLAKRTGGELNLTGAAPNVERVLKLARFDELFVQPTRG